MVEWIIWSSSELANFKQITHKVMLNSDNDDAKKIAQEMSTFHTNRLNERKYLGVDDWISGTTPIKKDS